MQVATTPDEDGEKGKKVYTISWTGENGQPGSLTITKGAQCNILTDSASVEEVTFNSFQMRGNAAGTVRYKTRVGQHLTIAPGAVGPRFLLPQIEQWGLHSQQLPESADRRRQQAAAASGRDEGQSQGNSEGQEEEAPRKRRRTQQQRADRRAKDDQVQAACPDIQQNSDWQGKVTSTFTIGAAHFDTFKLHKRARCGAFGMARYTALKNITFYRCSPCGAVLAGRKPAQRHKCTDKGGHARRGRAGGLLPGGVQLDAAIPRVGTHVS